MKPTLWIFSLEPLESRYTKQWHEHIPDLLKNKLGDKFRVVQVDGVQKNSKPTPGAFLNFADTNYWKSSQLCNFLSHFMQEEVGPTDQFIFTDAWNPVILQIKYMKDLLNQQWKLHGQWHAGSYDSHDFLGRIIGNAYWVRHTEKSIYYALDHNYFATKFHIDMFWSNLINDQVTCGDYSYRRLEEAINSKKIVQCGWPFEFLYKEINLAGQKVKKNLIVFPHRIAPEKQLDIFKDLAASMPQYQWMVCQEQSLTKEQYHTVLLESKMVFSANLQETLGIGCFEALCANSIPLVPNRLSYSEMYKDPFVYPSNWTQDWQSYQTHKEELIEKIHSLMNNYWSNTVQMALQSHQEQLSKTYFSAEKLIYTVAELEKQ